MQFKIVINIVEKSLQYRDIATGAVVGSDRVLWLNSMTVSS